MSLKQKTIGGLVWTLAQQFSIQLITFAVSVILARMLHPSEFGIFGMISILIALGTNLMDSGLTSSIIRTPDASQKDYSTVFVLNLVGSIVIYLIVFLTAPAVAHFYNQDILVNIIRVFCLTFIFNAFRSVQSAKLTKEMNFKTQMIIQIPSVLAGAVVGISLAFYGFGVWSLVWMYMVQSFLSALQHWLYSGWRPDLKFDLQTFKYHFNFGYKITLSGIIGTLYSNIYTIIIAKYFSAAQLGYYSRALSLRQLPISNLSAALNKVTYPMFSSLLDDDVKLKNVYKRVMQQVVFWVAPFLILLIVTAEPFIRFLLTEKWLPAVPYFQILCVAGIWLPLQAYNYNIIKVKGKTGLTLRIQLVKKLFGTIGVFIAVSFGIRGLLYFQIISTLIDYYLDAYYGGRMINYPMLEQILDILPSVGIALVIGAGTWFLDSFLVNSLSMPDLARLVICGLTYFVVYLGICHLFKVSAAKDFKKLILKK
jgi:O-antigen/teichoic acid export membrane protein